MVALQWERPPRPWAIVDGGEAVRLGEVRYRLADVAGFSAGEVFEPNVTGHLAAIGLFMGAGALFVLPVAMSLARPKFLLGGVLFIGIGLTALGEIRRHRSIHLHHLDVRMRSGETVRVSAVERAEIEALAAALGARLSPGH